MGKIGGKSRSSDETNRVQMNTTTSRDRELFEIQVHTLMHTRNKICILLIQKDYLVLWSPSCMYADARDKFSST